MNPDPCLTCGACCTYSFDWPEFTDETDYHLEAIPLDLCDTEYGRMKCDRDRCVALNGEVGVKVSCAIYEHRPNVCRSFRPNTPDCAKVRRYFHLEEHP